MDDEYTPVPAYPWNWKAAGVFVGDFLADTLISAGQMVRGISTQLAASVNNDINQREFRRQVAMEIETLTQEE